MSSAEAHTSAATAAAPAAASPDGGEGKTEGVLGGVRSLQAALDSALKTALGEHGMPALPPKDGAVVDGIVYYRPQRSLHLHVPQNDEEERAAELLGVTDRSARLHMTHHGHLKLTRVHDGQPAQYLMLMTGSSGTRLVGDDGSSGNLSVRGGALCWNGLPIAPPLTTDVKAYVDDLAKRDAVAAAKEAALAAATRRAVRRGARYEVTSYTGYRTWVMSRMVVDERKRRIDSTRLLQQQRRASGAASITLDSAPTTPHSSFGGISRLDVDSLPPPSPMDRRFGEDAYGDVDGSARTQRRGSGSGVDRGSGGTIGADDVLGQALGAAAAAAAQQALVEEEEEEDEEQQEEAEGGPAAATISGGH